MSNRVWGVWGNIHSCKESKASWRYTGTQEQKGGKERALGWHCKPAKVAGMSQWTRKAVRDWKEQVLCLYSKKRTWKITKSTSWSASSQFLWKLQDKKHQKTPTISNLIKVTRNNQPRFVICKSSLTTLLAFSDELTLWMAGAHWQPFLPIVVRFLTLSHLWRNGGDWTQWLNTRWVRDWVVRL